MVTVLASADVHHSLTNPTPQPLLPTFHPTLTQVGFLFGLGFDTATEITLLAIAALQGRGGTSPVNILFLPLLFTCGMTLADSLDGLIMLGLYGWAIISPLQVG